MLILPAAVAEVPAAPTSFSAAELYAVDRPTSDGKIYNN
jgi:hypothetical protein